MKQMRWIIVLTVLALQTPAQASERMMFVKGDKLNVRLCADTSCCVANRLRRDERVEVFEERDGWARISVYYDADSEAQCPKNGNDLIAQWVAARYLTTELPAGYDPNHWSNLLWDRRIRGIPNVGDYGLTSGDIDILRRYAATLLSNKECSAIETGNKSVGKSDTYYVHCEGESETRYFEASDLLN